MRKTNVLLMLWQKTYLHKNPFIALQCNYKLWHEKTIEWRPVIRRAKRSQCNFNFDVGYVATR